MGKHRWGRRISGWLFRTRALVSWLKSRPMLGLFITGPGGAILGGIGDFVNGISKTVDHQINRCHISSALYGLARLS